MERKNLSGPHLFSRHLVQCLNNPSLFINLKGMPEFLLQNPDTYMVQMNAELLFNVGFCRWYLSEGNRVSVHCFLICDYILSVY